MWLAFGISGWVACVLLIVILRRRPVPEAFEAERQLQQTSREFAAARRQHRAQMEAIHATLIEFEVDDRHRDPEAVQHLLEHLRSKTTPRTGGR